MKNFQRLCASVVLTLALSLPAFAGDMDCGVAPPPPPAPASASTQGGIETPRGDMDGGSGSTATAGDSIMEAALRLLQNVLSLF